jgi:hypothetical protein
MKYEKRVLQDRAEWVCFCNRKRSKKLEKTGFGGNARVLHLSIDLLVFLEEICKFMRSEQKRNQNAPGKTGAS